MRSSWSIITIAGISIEVHISFLLFLLLFLFFDASFLPVLLILFASITLHELSHSFVARLDGVDVSKIILLPIGGMSVMKNADLEPFSEFKMAIAGPMFNFVLCGLLLAFVWVTGWPNLLYTWETWNLGMEGALTLPYLGLMFSTVFWMNWLLGAFNLFLPAIPLDGGRVFRSMLALFMDYVKATRIATSVSKFVTVLLFLYALLSFNVILLLISIFIYFGASAEFEMALSSRLLSSMPIKKVLRKDYLVVDKKDTLDFVIAEMIKGKSLVAFTQEGDDFEYVTLYDIRAVPKAEWIVTPVDKISSRQNPVDIDHPADFALKRMMEQGIDVLPVLRKGKIVGAVFKSDLDRLFEILRVVND